MFEHGDPVGVERQRAERRGKVITTIIAIVMALGPVITMGRLLIGHWRFPAALWIFGFVVPVAFAICLYARFNWARVVVGWLSIGAVTINVLGAVASLDGRILAVTLFQSSVTATLGGLLLWSPSVRAHFDRLPDTAVDATS